MSISAFAKCVLGMCATVMALGGCYNSIRPTPAPGPSVPPISKISHIVVLVQENRSFNNLFAGYPGADTALEGPCTPRPWCKGTHIVKLRSVELATGPRNEGKDIDHSHHAFDVECDANVAKICQNDGFNLIRYGALGNGSPAYLYPYAYVDRTETAPYWKLARQYTLADKMFFTETAASFISHQMLISGTVQLNDHESATDEPPEQPWGCDAVPYDWVPVLYKDGTENMDSGVFPCFKWATIADLLDAKKISWLDYVDRCCQKQPFDFSGGVWNGFRAIHKIFYGPDWKTHISSPNTNIFTDLKGGMLPSVSWVIPTLYDSDHPASGCNGGPWWVTKVVDAVGTSRYWRNTAILLLWDDWGGWYDNVPPPQINYTSLGFRVPMIVISPYARANHISHTQYDFGSILKLIEQTFGLGSLGTTDASAPSMEDVFDFNQTTLRFIAAPLPKAMSCKSKVTNPKEMEEVIEHDGGPPE